MRKSKKMYAISLVFLGILTSFSSTYAYWQGLVDFSDNNGKGTIKIGNWSYSGGEDDTIIELAPDGTINLNIWVENNTLNQTLPQNTYYVYNNQLFKVTSASGYNPLWHGIPYSGSGGEGWAFINLSLEWAGASQRYTVGAIVKTDDGRFFQAMHAGNTNDPRTNNGPSTPINSGQPWREVMPMTDEMFPFIADSSLRNYTTPYSEYVIQLY